MVLTMLQLHSLSSKNLVHLYQKTLLRVRSHLVPTLHISLLECCCCFYKKVPDYFTLQPLFVSIDLSFVDKQTALVGMVGRMLVKHSILKTDVSTKLNIFCKFSIKWNTSHEKLFCFKQNQHVWLKNSNLFLILHLWLFIVFQSRLAKTWDVTLQKERSMVWLEENQDGYSWSMCRLVTKSRWNRTDLLKRFTQR